MPNDLIVSESRENVAGAMRKALTEALDTLDATGYLPEYFHFEVCFSDKKLKKGYSEEVGASIFGTRFTEGSHLKVYRGPVRTK